MAGSVNLNVTISGPLFSKKITDVVKQAIVTEIFNKAEDKVLRPSRKVQRRLGFRRNQLSPRKSGLTLEIASTVAKPRPGRRRSGPRRQGTPRPGWQENVKGYNPRTKGTGWTQTNVKAIQAIVKRGGPTIVRRIVGELS